MWLYTYRSILYVNRVSVWSTWKCKSNTSIALKNEFVHNLFKDKSYMHTYRVALSLGLASFNTSCGKLYEHEQSTQPTSALIKKNFIMSLIWTDGLLFYKQYVSINRLG